MSKSSARRRLRSPPRTRCLPTRAFHTGTRILRSLTRDRYTHKPHVSADALPYLCWEHFCPGEKDELRRRRSLWRCVRGSKEWCRGGESSIGVRHVNRAIESAREMERSASVAYVGHSTGTRLRSSCCLPPARPSRHTPSCARNTLPGACTHVHAAPRHGRS
jgi:hypothetical protein